jgi:hypothetical protein
MKLRAQTVVGWLNSVKIGIERHGDTTFRYTFPQFVDRVADELAQENPRFDKSRFISAVLGEEEVG